MGRERSRASDAGGDARVVAAQHELRPGAVPGAPSGRADGSELDGARAAYGARGRETPGPARAARRVQASPSGPADGMDDAPGRVDGRRRARAVGGDAGPEPGDALDERARGGSGAARDGDIGDDAGRDRSTPRPPQELGVAADRTDRAAAPGVDGADPGGDLAAGGGPASARVAPGQPDRTSGGPDAPRIGEPRHGVAGAAVADCGAFDPGVSPGASSRGAGKRSGGRSPGAAGPAADCARTTPAAAPADPAGSSATDTPGAAAESSGRGSGDPRKRPHIDDVVAVPPGGGSHFRKTAARLRRQRRADRDDEIQELLAQGYKNKAIARRLGI